MKRLAAVPAMATAKYGGSGCPLESEPNALRLWINIVHYIAKILCFACFSFIVIIIIVIVRALARRAYARLEVNRGSDLFSVKKTMYRERTTPST